MPGGAAGRLPPPVTRAGWVILVLGVFLFVLRLLGPADLTDNDQERPASYVLDAVQNGHWLIQRDAYDDMASKPPLFTWLAGLATECLGGRLTRFTLYLPSAAALVATALLVNAAAGRHFGALAGLFGALSLVFSSYGYKHMVLARNDALFACTVTLGALAAWGAWHRGQGWTGFWLAAAAATLTKGPLGVLLAAGGLLATVWERKAADPLPLRGRLWPGAVLWLGLVGGWFLLAWGAAGDDLVQKQLGRELAGHLTGAEAGGKLPFSDPLHPLLYFLSRYAPWSLAATVGFWRVWRRPAAEASERRFERFLFCWFAVGLAVFTLAPHKRPDLLLPLIPAAAMLAGREVARGLTRFPEVQVRRGVIVGAFVLLAGLAVGRPLGRDTAIETRNTAAQRALAEWWRDAGPAHFPLTFVAHTLTAQFYLNRHQLVVSPKQAARLLLADAPAVLVTRDLPALHREWPADFQPVVLRAEPPEAPRAWLVANRPLGGLGGGPVAVGIGPLQVRLDGVELVRARRHDLEVRRSRSGARLEVGNTSTRPVPVGVIWLDAPGRPPTRKILPGGTVWAPEVPPPKLSQPFAAER